MAAMSELAKRRLRVHLDEVESWPGGILQQQVRWRPDAWLRSDRVPILERLDVVQVADRLRKFSAPNGDGWYRISRSDVLEAADSNASLFMASMIFGFGPTGYGPARVIRMIESTPDILQRLDRQAQAGVEGDGEVWEAITRAAKIKGLGIAFGTKFTYFAGLKNADGVPQTLIDDVNTSWAVYGLADVVRSLNGVASFCAYQRLCREWASEFGVRADVIEYALFEDGQVNMAEYRSKAMAARERGRGRVPRSVAERYR